MEKQNQKGSEIADQVAEVKPCDAKKQERPWLKREIQLDDMQEIMNQLKDYEFPTDALQETYHPTMQKKILGYNAQYIINALNEVIGINHWREIGKMEIDTPKTAHVAVYEGSFQIGNWKEEKIEGKTETYFSIICEHSTYGGSRNMDKWEALKGARTNFLKKVASYFSLGWKSYALQLDEDFANLQNMKVEGTPTKATPPAKKPTQTPPPPAEEEIKMITDKQKQKINAQYENYLELSDNAKTIGQLIAPYKKQRLDELTLKEASHFIDLMGKHIIKLEDTAKEEKSTPPPAKKPTTKKTLPSKK